MHLAFVRLASSLQTPGKNFFVASAFLDALRESRVIDSQEVHAFAVKALSEVRPIFLGQLAFSLNTNLVEHSAEVDQTAYLFLWTADGEIFHWADLRFYPAQVQVRRTLRLSNGPIGGILSQSLNH